MSGNALAYRAEADHHDRTGDAPVYLSFGHLEKLH
jgi:hypothetical protein